MKKEHFEQKQLPVGAGEKIVEKRKELTVPAIEVDNEVLWINPAFKEAPFKLEEGKSTKLGMFFTPKPEMHDASQIKNLPVMPEVFGGRSGLVGSAIFRDAEGRLYRDVDIKGVGLFELSQEGGYTAASFRIEDKEADPQGLLSYGKALRDQEYSEIFLKAGIRTHRIIAIIGLKEFINKKGNKKALPRKVRKWEPVISMRAFGTKERIKFAENRERMLDDARMLVAQELNENTDTFPMYKYYDWFAETLGKQVAKIRKLGLHDGYLTEHNITLDCRIVDLDSVTTVEETIKQKKKVRTEEELYFNDFKRAQRSLESLLEKVGRTGTKFTKDCLEKYEQSYKNELQNKS